MMLIDRFLPIYHHNEIHGRMIEAPLEATYEAARHLDFSRSRVIRVLFALRGMKVPERSLAGMTATGGFTVIGEEPPHAFVIGMKGHGLSALPIDAESFREPSHGGIRIAFDFRLREGDGHTEVITETRILCDGRAARLIFRLYWLVIRPFSGWVRLEMLRCLDVQAREITSRYAS